MFYQINVRGIPSGSKPQNAISHQWWYHCYSQILDIIVDHQLPVFSRVVKHLWFSVFSELLCWSLIGESKLSFRLIIETGDKLKQVWQDNRRGTDRIRGKTRNYECKEETAYDVELIKNLIFVLFNISSWAFTTSFERPPFEIHLLLSRKKDCFAYAPRSSIGFPSSIQGYLNKQNYGLTIFTSFYWRCF